MGVGTTAKANLRSPAPQYPDKGNFEGGGLFITPFWGGNSPIIGSKERGRLEPVSGHEQAGHITSARSIQAYGVDTRG